MYHTSTVFPLYVSNSGFRHSGGSKWCSYVLVARWSSKAEHFPLECICVVKKNEMGDEDMTEIDGRCRAALTGVAREAHWQGDIWPETGEVSHTEVLGEKPLKQKKQRGQGLFLRQRTKKEGQHGRGGMSYGGSGGWGCRGCRMRRSV